MHLNLLLRQKGLADIIDDAIPYLSIYLGHDSLDETSKYLKFSSELFPEAVENFGDFMYDLLPEVDYEA